MAEDLNEISLAVKSLKSIITDFKIRNIEVVALYLEDLKELKKLIKERKLKRAKNRSNSLRMVQNDIENIRAEYLQMHIDVSKIGKKINSIFDKEITPLVPPSFTRHDSVMKSILFDELLLNSSLDVVEMYKNESQTFSKTYEFHTIISLFDAINSFLTLKNFDALIKFLSQFNQEKPKILYEIYKRKFYDAILQNNMLEAIQISKSFFDFPEFEDQTSLLSSALVSPSNDSLGVHVSKIESLIISSDKILDEVVNTVFHSKKYPRKSLLQICFSAGCLTAFETYNTVCGTIFRQKDSIHELEEIQSKIFLPQSEFVFHSIIVCPIQQNEIQGTESAIRLECGHVISLNNANEMRSANTPGDIKILCPICNKRVSSTNYLTLRF